jgi:hypothetical protein
MEANTVAPGWGLWTRWAVASFIGWIVGVVAAIGLTYAIMALIGLTEETNIFVGVFMGACMGLAQIMGARGRMRLGARWVWGATAGMGLAFVVAILLGQYVLRVQGPIDLWLIPIAVVGGLLAGFFQKASLKPYTRRYNLWPLLGAISWGVAWVAANFTGDAGGLIAGVVFGVVTGAAIVWLVRDEVEPSTT